MTRRLLSESDYAAHQARVRKPMGALPVAPEQPCKPRKYRNEPQVDEEGIRHDSRRELKRWRELRLMLKAGEITWLARQVHFSLPGATTYIADFFYEKPGYPSVTQVVEDVKSPQTRKTQAYRIKFRQMEAIHGITIKEVL